MNNDQCQWVALPYFLLIDKKKLKYQDALIYITIRSFLNGESGDCFPSFETIALKAGVSRNFVIQSIKRLRSSGLIDYTTSKATRDKNNSNKYSFEELYGFEQIPVSFFQLNELTWPEKSILLSIRQFFSQGWLTTTFSMTEMAYWIGITYKSLYTQFMKLISKGYIEEVIKYGRKRYILTSKVEWITGQKKPNQIKNKVKGRLLVC